MNVVFDLCFVIDEFGAPTTVRDAPESRQYPSKWFYVVGVVG